MLSYMGFFMVNFGRMRRRRSSLCKSCSMCEGSRKFLNECLGSFPLSSSTLSPACWPSSFSSWPLRKNARGTCCCERRTRSQTETTLMRVTERRTAIGEDWLLAMTIPRRPTLLLLPPPLIPRDVGHQACPSSTMIPLAVTRSRPRHSPARRARRNESPACYGSVGRKQARLSFSVRRQEEERGGYGMVS